MEILSHEKNISLTNHVIFLNRPNTKKTLVGTLAMAGFGVGAAGATTALATVSLTGAGFVGAAGAMFFVGATIKSAMKNFKGKNYK